jgi:ACS family pantothenate transporter-like MFS transporter
MGAGPLILSWINEISTADTEKRALLVAMANDLAYVVQAVVSVDIYWLMQVFFSNVANTLSGAQLCVENNRLSSHAERIYLGGCITGLAE